MDGSTVRSFNSNDGINVNIRFFVTIDNGEKGNVTFSNISIEEGTQATPYESYKESKQELYLDEPLYKDNELCVHNGQLGYWKNRERIVLDGSDDETITDIGAVKNETTEFRCGRLANPHNTINMICDKFKYSDGLWGETTEGFFGFENSKYAIDFRISNFRLSTIDAKGFREWLQANPTTVIYELTEPIFVPILENTPQWILNCFNECTLSIDSNITATSMSATYSGNVVSVVALEDVQYQQDAVIVDLATQVAVMQLTR